MLRATWLRDVGHFRPTTTTESTNWQRASQEPSPYLNFIFQESRF